MPSAHPTLTWAARHASSIHYHYHVGTDGRTPWERVAGKRAGRRVAEFGETDHVHDDEAQEGESMVRRHMVKTRRQVERGVRRDQRRSGSSMDREENRRTRTMDARGGSRSPRDHDDARPCTRSRRRRNKKKGGSRSRAGVPGATFLLCRRSHRPSFAASMPRAALWRCTVTRSVPTDAAP